METVYAMIAGAEAFLILVLIGLLLAQRETIKEYRRDYLERGAAHRYART